jgi:hypothetical protein
VFNVARNYAINELNYIPRQNQQSHAPVWEAFKTKGGTFRIVRDKGLALKERREMADYDDEIEDLDSLLELAFKEVEVAFHWLDKICGTAKP